MLPIQQSQSLRFLYAAPLCQLSSHSPAVHTGAGPPSHSGPPRQQAYACASWGKHCCIARGGGGRVPSKQLIKRAHDVRHSAAAGILYNTNKFPVAAMGLTACFVVLCHHSQCCCCGKNSTHRWIVLWMLGLCVFPELDLCCLQHSSMRTWA